MKKIITLATLGLLVAAAPISAQTVYDAAKITGKDLNGTAQSERILPVSVSIAAMIL